MASKLFMLSEKQMELISPYLPKPRGNPRADDRLVLGGIIFMRRAGIPRDLAPPEQGNPNTLYKRFVRWTRGGVFDRTLAGLSAAKVRTAMIDSARCKARRTAASLKAGPVPGANDDELPEGRKRKIGMTKGGRNTKVHALCDGKGRPTFILLTAGNANDCTVATSLIDRMQARAKTFLADKGCDTDEIREELKKRKVEARIPSKANRKEPIPHDETKYARRQEIERMFGRIEDWRSIAMRYDRCHDLFMGAVVLASIFIFWL